MGKQQNNNGNGSPVKKKLRVLICVFLLIFLGCILFDFQGKPFHWSVKPRAWTGFGESVDKNSLTVTETGAGKTIIKTTTTDKLEPAKTLWDWMSLLLAPATLAGLGFWFQHLLELAKEEQADKDKDRAADQQREKALQNYLNSLSELLVDKQLKNLLHPGKKKFENKATASTPVTQLLEESSDEAVDSPSIDALAALDVIKARTLSLLRLFDQDIPRKASVLSFLGDAELLTDLKLDMSMSNWEKANLNRVNLSGAYLRGADLSKTDLKEANLRRANLRRANLFGADLRGANLNEADLSEADLSSANLSGVNLNEADLFGADLSSANLFGADLRRANLSSASLHGVNLSGANLSEADLREADLQKAHYTDNSTSEKTCKVYFENYPCPTIFSYPCPTIFPPNFDPKAAGMVLAK